MAGHHAAGVANAVLDAAWERGLSVSPMQLQKLLYFCQGWNLEVRGQPLVSDNFHAWQYGPVHPYVYNAFKHFGSAAIDEPIMFDGGAISANLSPEERRLIGEVVSIYGRLSGPQMSHLTHAPGTPWYEVWNGGVGKNDVIPLPRIEREFQELRKRAA